MAFRRLGPALVLLGVVLAGCDGGSTLEIRPRGSLEDSTSLAGIRLEVNGRTITAGSFAPDESGLTEVKLDVPNSGRLTIHVELRQGGRTAVSESFSWEMAEDWEWGMDIFRQASDPTVYCLGCAGDVAFGVAPWAAREPGESLWFAWGGKPRGSDIVF